MLSKTLDVHKDISNSTDQISSSFAKQQIPFRVTSTCSCSQCNSITCFQIRNNNAKLLCTCNNCKETFSSKIGDNHKKNTKEEKDDQKNPLNCRDVENIKSVKESNCQVAEKEDKQKTTLDTKNELLIKNSNEERYLAMNKKKFQEEVHQLNRNTRSDLRNKSYLDLTRNIIQEDNQKCALHTTSNLTNNKLDDQGCHSKIRKAVKINEQKDVFHVNTKSNSNEKYHGKIHCEGSKKDDNRNEQRDALFKQIKSESSNKINFVDKNCCKKTKTDGKEKEVPSTSKTDLPHKKLDDKFHETSRKNANDHEQRTFNKPIKNDKSKIDSSKHSAFSYKDTTFIRDKVKKTDTSFEKSYTRNYSVAMTYTPNEDKAKCENPATTLSAQIMNLPTQDFKDSLSSHKTACQLNTNKIITKQDILTRLMDIYKACSCKVCECISGFSGKDVSKENTCGYEDTKHTHTRNTISNHSLTSGCACYRCDRKDCRGLWKKKTKIANCDCKPCECVNFTKKFTKPCDCEPCQCAECEFLNFHIPRSVIVAPVQGNFQQNLCQCEPCECVHCSHNYGAMASSLMREVSTGMVSHGNCTCESCVNSSCQFDGVDCRCDTQNRIIRKPIDRSVRDYDLRRAIIGENSFTRKQSSKFKNCDTIAMFAFSNNCSNTVFNTFGDGCHCMSCECVICKDNEMCGNIIKNSYEDLPLVFSSLSDQSISACKCQPCECQVNCKNKKFERDAMKATRAVNDCVCEITCDCIACKGLQYCSQDNEIKGYSKSSLKNKLDDNSNENCKNFSNSISRHFSYPFRKGKLLTPSMFEAKILSHTQSQSQTNLIFRKKPLPNMSIVKANGNKLNKTRLCLQNITVCQNKPVKQYFGSDNNQSSFPNLLSTCFLNDCSINTVSQKYESTIIENNTIRNDTHAQNNKNNIEPPTSISMFPNNSFSACVDNSINKVIEHNKSHIVANNNEAKLLNGNLKSFCNRLSKTKINSDVNLICNRIISFENSISQLQEDVKQNLKTLAEIRSINGMSDENFSESNTKLIYNDSIMFSENALCNLHETRIADTAKFIDKMQKPEFEKMENIIADCTDKSSNYNIKYDQNDNFSKGDIKMYTKLIKRPLVSVRKLRKNITKSRVKKLSVSTENKISDFISSHLREKYRQRGKNNFLNFKFTRGIKSASTSYENCTVVENKNFKINDDNDYAQTVIEEAHPDESKLWSVLNKNLYIINNAVTHKSNITELERNIKRAVQSVSLQTNESRGYAALTKLQIEVSNLLNSPLLQLGCSKSYLIDNNIVDEENIHLKPKTKLQIEVSNLLNSPLLQLGCSKSYLNDNNIVDEEKIQFKPKSSKDLKNVRSAVASQTRKPTLLVEKETICNIGQTPEEMVEGMQKLVDLILTRTVCTSEMTKPNNALPETPRMSKVTSVKIDYDALKASFLGLRRISDHTVLVRWKMPREVQDVQGYELQVDGRPVQKILSPTRCMAVLTCLPHCDKLLLTIRTLTFSDLPPGHHPAATVVYCPREKRTRYSRPNLSGEL